MLNFDDWAINFLESEKESGDISRSSYEYKYSNLEQWLSDTIDILVCEELINLIRSGIDPFDALIKEQDKMYRMALKTKNENNRERFMNAFYLCENFMNVFSDEEWSREDEYNK